MLFNVFEILDILYRYIFFVIHVFMYSSWFSFKVILKCFIRYVFPLITMHKKQLFRIYIDKKKYKNRWLFQWTVTTLYTFDCTNKLCYVALASVESKIESEKWKVKKKCTKVDVQMKNFILIVVMTLHFCLKINHNFLKHTQLCLLIGLTFSVEMCLCFGIYLYSVWSRIELKF